MPISEIAYWNADYLINAKKICFFLFFQAVFPGVWYEAPLVHFLWQTLLGENLNMMVENLWLHQLKKVSRLAVF